MIQSLRSTIHQLLIFLAVFILQCSEKMLRGDKQQVKGLRQKKAYHEQHFIFSLSQLKPKYFVKILFMGCLSRPIRWATTTTHPPYSRSSPSWPSRMLLSGNTLTNHVCTFFICIYTKQHYFLAYIFFLPFLKGSFILFQLKLYHKLLW